MVIAESTDSVLAWVRYRLPERYAAALHSLIEDADLDRSVVGLLLTGSLARRDALPGTDIDLRVVVRETPESPFRRFDRFGVPVEQAFATERAAAELLQTQPMHVYAHLDGVALLDPDSALARLRSRAAEVFADYRMPAGQRSLLADQLAHPEHKARVAYAAGDLAKAVFSLTTASWQLLEGLWAANDRPMPPNASVRPHLADLHGPPGLARQIDAFFMGDPVSRVEAGLLLLSWTRDRLTRTD